MAFPEKIHTFSFINIFLATLFKYFRIKKFNPGNTGIYATAIVNFELMEFLKN